MDWIKKNPVQFVVMIVAVIAIASSIYLFTRIQNFSSTVTGAPGAQPPPSKEATFDAKPLEDALDAIHKPVSWQIPDRAGRLFVSKKYVLDDGKLVDPRKGIFHPPVPNAWLIDHDLDPLTATVLDEDPDEDGFTTREEFAGLDTLAHLAHIDNNLQPVPGADGKPLPADSTNPRDSKSHPPYHTKLQLERIISNRFLITFKAHNLVPNKPENNSFQLNFAEIGSTVFVGIGEKISGTKFTVKSFQFKEIPGKDNTKNDVSELTITNNNTGVDVVLPLNKTVDSPDKYAVFRHHWKLPKGPDSQSFAKKKGEEFSLEADKDEIYKLLDIRTTDVEIQLPIGEKKILALPAASK